jgi:sugar O-acyltransferase (sialic acid O-acetyltransferase NeuD family)
MGRVVVFGMGEIAELALFYLRRDTEHEVVAFTVDEAYMKASSFCGLPVVPFEEVHLRYPPDQFRMFVAVGYSGVNRLRAGKYQEVKERGYSFISYISPHCLIAENVQVGENCFIFEQNNIQPFVRIGNNVTVWSANHIGHHSTIGDHCFIASHVVISGGVTVEPYCFIGVNAAIGDHITIGRDCIIGAGALILKDTRAGGVYAGHRALFLEKSSFELEGRRGRR